MKILETKNLSFAYKDGEQNRQILNNVDTSFETGVFYTILGASGSGKSTFLSLIGALEIPQQGCIEYMGNNINDIGLDKYRRKNIALIFQNYNLITYMTAIENVLLAMSISKESAKIENKEAYHYLSQVGIDHSKANRLVTKLSGGEQQRVAIARALSTDVDIIIADEPTGNVDQQTSRQIVEIFKNLAHNENKCIIVVTHSKEVSDESDVVLFLDTSIQNFVIQV